VIPAVVCLWQHVVCPPQHSELLLLWREKVGSATVIGATLTKGYSQSSTTSGLEENKGFVLGLQTCNSIEMERSVILLEPACHPAFND